jgi:DNA protecting protein DprA
MNDSIAVLQLFLTPGLGAKTFDRLLKRLEHERVPISELVSLETSVLIESFDLKPGVASSIADQKDQAEAVSAELEQHEINILLKGDENYPPRLANALGDEAPPCLFAKGNPDILKRRSVGFCGSRNASDENCKMAMSIANQLARSGINVISGYAFGVDTAAHIGALDSGGVTTFVLPTGILSFSPKSAVASLLEPENHVILSEFPPNLGWHSHNAMKRNSTICCLSNAIVLVESGMEGGTFAAGKAALKLQRSLFVLQHDDPYSTPPGNRFFIERGARPLDISASGEVDLSALLETVATDSEEPPQTSFLSEL